jgi:Cysteinyl-tRNA synthetase
VDRGRTQPARVHLGLRRDRLPAPDIEPRATGHIPEMIVLIRRLIGGDHAYPGGGDVYFDVHSYPGYGALSGQRWRRCGPPRTPTTPRE